MAATIKIAGLIAGIFLVSFVQEAFTSPFGHIGAAISGSVESQTFRPATIGTIGSTDDAFIQSGGYGYTPVKETSNYYQTKPAETLSCESDALHCVPEVDCQDDPLKGTRQCPPMWKKIGGACYFVANSARVRLRSQPEARQYCKDIGGVLLWIENEYEKKFVNESAENPFWTDGVYNKKQNRGLYNQKQNHWYWENNWVELIFKNLDGGKSNDNPAITSPTDQRLCLSIGKLGFTPDTCYEKKNVVCKMGSFDNSCEGTTRGRTSLGRCCWGPSYQYYYRNLIGTSSYNTNMETGSRGNCFVLFNGDIITCEKAFEELKNLPTFRIAKSIYYLSSATDGCSGAREAVISNEEIHLTIVRFLMTVEKFNIKIKIGLVIKPIDTGSTLLWVNGKSHSYFKKEYWAVGHPKMSGLTGCVMYADTGIDGSGSYLWHSVESDAECSDSKNMVLCELPIRNSDFQPEKKKQTCGIRQSGGVMGRSYSSGNDHEEARFGEWPWQAAILNTKKFSLGVGQEFACSGALLSHDVVLTSAHCVRGLLHSALLVSLGDYDLEAVNQRKLLHPIVVKVRDVVVHPDYNSQDGTNDLAIVNLAESVSYIDHAHINIGCLPSLSILYAGGDWECYVTGWPTPSYHSGRRLQRVEVDFVRRKLCRRQTSRNLYDGYGRLLRNPHAHSYNQKKEPELLCVEPWDTNTCLADSTNLLVCKKNAVFNDDPFNLGAPDDSDLYDGQEQQQGGIQSYAESNRVINAYGANRFNAEKWYLIGVGHQSNSCRTPGYTVFTPVHEFLTFIHGLIDERS